MLTLYQTLTLNAKGRARQTSPNVSLSSNIIIINFYYYLVVFQMDHHWSRKYDILPLNLLAVIRVLLAVINPGILKNLFLIWNNSTFSLMVTRRFLQVTNQSLLLHYQFTGIVLWHGNHLHWDAGQSENVLIGWRGVLLFRNFIVGTSKITNLRDLVSECQDLIMYFLIQLLVYLLAWISVKTFCVIFMTYFVSQKKQTFWGLCLIRAVNDPKNHRIYKRQLEIGQWVWRYHWLIHKQAHHWDQHLLHFLVVQLFNRNSHFWLLIYHILLATFFSHAFSFLIYDTVNIKTSTFLVKL